MKPAKIFSIMVVLAVAVYGAIGWYLLPLASFDGDLTRTGKLPEALFGWTRPQPALASQWLNSANWQDADVLVIGDSFSAGRVWQTQLTRAGLQVHTETWNSLHSICGDFLPWLKATGFKGRYIVIEIIERNALDTLDASLACAKMATTPASQVSEFGGPPATQVDRGRRTLDGRLSVGMSTWLNTRTYRRLSQRADFSTWQPNAMVTVARVPDGCRLFSHPRCQDGLFYGGDHQGDFDNGMLDKMNAIDARLAGYTPIWLIVPDKSTTYLHADKSFWTRAAARFNAPDVLKNFRQALDDKVVDLYPANNTHVSTTGYLRLGDLVLAQIRSRPAVPPAAAAHK